jgi:hypothetical protein
MTVQETINSVIQGEVKELIKYQGAPFIKFQLIVTSIEFLGACLDQHDFETKDHSEQRFNAAISKLFPKKYHKYAKSNSSINLYRDLRCGMIHKLRPLGTAIGLASKQNSPCKHLEIKNETLILVLEDFYEDLYAACESLKKKNLSKKLPTKKMEGKYLSIHNNITGSTVTDVFSSIDE